MDKEIIIDGVDVSGCEFSCENPLHEIKHSCNVRGCEKDNGLHIHLKCKNNPNCYYKQLKRKEQERNEWKKKYEDAANENLLEIYELIKKNDAWRGIVNVVNGKLEQENAELKEQLNKKDDLINDITNGGIQLQKECERLKKQYNCYACDSCSGKEDYINMKRHTENAIKTVHKYRQALQEIREKCQITDVFGAKDIRDILDKINSVIGAE